ncbi:MAG: hypothetical protein R3352_07985 [Salinisphaeraceae bacterium]|nr:hypothetical protein [Salinisphaeraceae bacterium]
MQRSLIAAAVLLLVPSWAQAEPAFARMYKSAYGYTPSCNACHKDGGGTPVNQYGEQFKQADMLPASFKQIAKLDADGDGFSNGEEAAAKANPGSANSTPKNKGEWLDTANLIPKEVQALFPDVRSYLPKDAVLTDEEIKRAAAMGAELSKADENTIYIPVENKKAAGTAIIVPAVHQGKQFFLVVATDPKLKLTHVEPFNTQHVPAAEDAPVYAKLVGQAVKDLPTADGQSLEAVITNTVKRAGTLLYVRLKK